MTGRTSWLKKTAAVLAAFLMMILPLAGCMAAEATTTAPWENEAGWISLTLALTAENSEGVWDEAAKTFGESLGIPLSGKQLQSMMLQGYNKTSNIDSMLVQGSKITIFNKEGTEILSRDYAFVEALEGVYNNSTWYVFEAKDAGKYTYLIMTLPEKQEEEAGEYIAFNLFHAQKDYMGVFDTQKASFQMPCTMIQKDTSEENLLYLITSLFSAPVTVVK